MGSDISKSAYRALLIQDPRLTYDDSYDTTATPTSSLPIPERSLEGPPQETELVLESGGVQAAAKTLNVRAQRAGHPRPGGGSFLHKYSTATGSLQWNGWDPPNVIHRFEWIDWSGGIQNRPDIIRRQDDGLVVVMQRGTSNIRCWRRVRDEDQVSPSWSESAVASGSLVLVPRPSRASRAIRRSRTNLPSPFVRGSRATASSAPILDTARLEVRARSKLRASGSLKATIWRFALFSPALRMGKLAARRDDR